MVRPGSPSHTRTGWHVSFMLVVGMLVCGSGRAAWAGDTRWAINPPPDWAETTAATLQMPAMQAMQRRLVAGAEEHEIRAYLSSNGASLVAIWARVLPDADGSSFDDWEAGLRSSLARVSADFVFRRRVDRTAVVLDAAAGASGRRGASLRSIAGKTADGALVSVMAMCTAAAPVCNRVLDTLVLDRRGLVPVLEHDLASPDNARANSRPARRDVVDKKSAVYRAGKIAAIVFGVILVLLILSRLRRRW